MHLFKVYSYRLGKQRSLYYPPVSYIRQQLYDIYYEEGIVIPGLSEEMAKKYVAALNVAWSLGFHEGTRK